MGFDIQSSKAQFPKKKFDKVALIDADRYKHLTVYRVFERINKGEEWSRDLVREVLDDYLYRDIFSAFEARAIIFCFSAPSKDVFRNWITQEKKYKKSRAKSVDNYDYPQKWEDMAYVFEYVAENHMTLIYQDLEADDLLSMLQHPTDTFIFSHDKDLKQVVGFHYDMTHRILMYTDEKEGFRMLVNQVLTGDTTDDIPGLRGFGEKAAIKFEEETKDLEDFELLTEAIKKFTDKYGVLHGMDAFAEMWHLVSMRLDRGAHNREKYHKAFTLVEKLLDNGEDTYDGSSKDTPVLSR
jgi:5'-3' exonuclease